MTDHYTLGKLEYSEGAELGRELMVSFKVSRIAVEKEIADIDHPSRAQDPPNLSHQCLLVRIVRHARQQRESNRRIEARVLEWKRSAICLHEPRRQRGIDGRTTSEHASREVRSDSTEVASANQFAKHTSIPAPAVQDVRARNVSLQPISPKFVVETFFRGDTIPVRSRSIEVHTLQVPTLSARWPPKQCIVRVPATTSPLCRVPLGIKYSTPALSGMRCSSIISYSNLGPPAYIRRNHGHARSTVPFDCRSKMPSGSRPLH